MRDRKGLWTSISVDRCSLHPVALLRPSTVTRFASQLFGIDK
jgi:hypothetical protein